MILILLLLSKVWLGIWNLQNVKRFKKISEKLMPIAWHPKRWWNFCMSEDDKNRNRVNFYFLMLLMYTTWEYWNILPLDIVQKSLWISSRFDTQSLDIVRKSLWISSHFDIIQIFVLSDFFGTFVSIYIFKTIYHKKT